MADPRTWHRLLFWLKSLKPTKQQILQNDIPKREMAPKPCLIEEFLCGGRKGVIMPLLKKARFFQDCPVRARQTNDQTKPKACCMGPTYWPPDPWSPQVAVINTSGSSLVVLSPGNPMRRVKWRFKHGRCVCFFLPTACLCWASKPKAKMTIPLVLVATLHS